MPSPIRTHFFSAAEMNDCLESVLAASPADETELVWLDRRRGTTVLGSAATALGQPADERLEPPRLSVLVRVVEGGRMGWFRTESADPHGLEDAVRHALALAKTQPRAKRQPLLPTDASPIELPAPLADPAIGDLDLDAARRLHLELAGGAAGSRLDWVDLRLAVFNSHGLRRTASAGRISLALALGEAPGAGRAAASARGIADLRRLDLGRRAARWHAGPEVPAASELPPTPCPILLAPEATIALLDLLNAYAFAGRRYLDGVSLLSRHRNVQVFDRAFHLADDATRADGLPFPFDLEGSPKRHFELVADGRPSNLALSQAQGAEAGLPPTAQSIGGRDAMFGNLFLALGEADEAALLAAADGGIRIGWIEPPECQEPTQLHVRATARGVRRIRDGRVAEALPDLVWEDSLLRALGRLRAVGRDPVVRATRTTPFGGISAPSLVLESAEGLRLPRRRDPRAA